MSRPEILLAQPPPGDVAELVVVFGERLAEFFLEQAAHIGGRHVQGGSDDVNRPLMGHLYDVLAEIGFDGANVRRFEHVIQLHFLANHRLRLDHAVDVVLFGDVEHVLVGLGRIVGPQHGRAAGGHVPLEFNQQLIEVGDRILFDLMGSLAPVLKERHRLGGIAALFRRSFHRLAEGLRRRWLGKTLGQRGKELGAAEMYGCGHWIEINKSRIQQERLVASY